MFFIPFIFKYVGHNSAKIQINVLIFILLFLLNV